jgi:hypothetical protein
VAEGAPADSLGAAVAVVGGAVLDPPSASASCRSQAVAATAVDSVQASNGAKLRTRPLSRRNEGE